MRVRAVRKQAGRVLRWRGTGLVLTALIVVIGATVAVRTIDVGHLFDAVRQADSRLLALAVGVYALSWPLRGRRYDDILGAMGQRCGLWFQTAAVFLSQTANLVVPARAGDGARVYLLNQHKQVPYATGGASLAVERLFDLLALAAFGALAGAWLVVTGRGIGPGETRTFVGGAVLVAGVAVVAAGGIVTLARSDRAFGAAVRTRIGHPKLETVVDALVRFGGDVRVVAADPRALVRIGAGSLAIWALDVLTAVLVLAALAQGALGGPALLAVGTLAVTVGNLAKVLPLSQGGIGLYEAAFTGLVVAISPVGAATALAAAILDHALKNAVTLAGGALAAVGLNTSIRPAGRGVDRTEPESSEF